MRKRMTGIGSMLAALLVAAASWASEGPAPVAKPAARPAGVPAEAVVWMVIPAPRATLDRLKKLVDGFQPGAGGMVEMLVKQGSPWGFEEADETKTVIAIVQPPKKADEKPGWAAVGSLKAGSDGAAALEKRFGGKPAKTEAGLSVFTQVQEGALPDKEIFAAVKDGRVTLGDSKELVKLLSACPAPGEGAYPAGVDLLGGVDVKALAAQYKDQIEVGLKEFEANAFDGLPGMDDENVGKQLKALAKTSADWSRAALRDVETLGWRVKLGDSVSMAVSARAAAGSAFAAWLADAEKLQLPATKALPEGGIFSMAAALPMERTAELMAALMKPFYQAAGGDDKTKKASEEMMTAFSAYAKAMDGKMAVAVLRRGGGISAVGYAGLKDQAVARDNFLKTFKLLESGPLAEAMAKSGAKYAIKEKAREAGGQSVDRVTVDLKLPADPNMPAEVQEMQKKLLEKLLGLPMIEDFAFLKDRFLMSFGKEAEPALDELAARDSGAKPGTEAMAGTIGAAPKGAFLAGELYVTDYVKLMMEIVSDAAGGMLPIPKLELPREKTPLTGYLAAADGEFSAELRVPVEPIRKLVEAFKKMQADMMGNQPAVPLPVE